MLLNATLTKITDYKGLIFQISKETFDKIRLTKVDEKTTWEYEFELSRTEDANGEEVVESETRYYCKVNLDRFDKAIVEKKFNPFVKKEVTVSVQIDSFTPKPSEDIPEPKLITYFTLKKITKAGPYLRPAPVEAAKDSGEAGAVAVRRRR